MRPERNPLDLNILPDDYTSRDGKQFYDDSSSSGCRKSKSGSKDGKDECDKVYECRFCSLKFCKSQALGGHMNRHRQERETETLNRARQLVFNSDNLAAQAPHLGCHPLGSYNATSNIVDPYRSVYPSRLLHGSSSTILQPTPQPLQQPYMYTSPSRIATYASHSQYPQQPINDYYVGHVLNSNNSSTGAYHMGSSHQVSSYTCIGAPVGHGSFGGAASGRGGSERDGSLSFVASAGGGGGSQHKHLDPTSSINRFQDGS